MSTLATINAVSLTLGNRCVLSGVSQAFQSGEIVALVGPNGAGKSSLLKLLAGLIRPGAGSVSLDGLDIAMLKPPAIARLIAYLPQAREIHWPMAVRAIVALGRLPHQAAGATTPDNDAAVVEAAMQQMHIAGLAERPVLALSGGEQARVLMARALAQEPQLLLADEPTAGLDLGHQLDLMTCLSQRAVSGRASIVALHDLGLAARFATKVILLAEGRIVAAGPPLEVLTEARIRDVYKVNVTLAHVDGLPVFVPRGPTTGHDLPAAIV